MKGSVEMGSAAILLIQYGAGVGAGSQRMRMTNVKIVITSSLSVWEMRLSKLS